MSKFSSLSIEETDGITVLTLDRPDKRNAVDGPLIADIEDFFSAPPEATRVVVLTGAGDHYCAGLDIAELKVMGAAEAQATSRAWHRTTEKIQFGALLQILASFRIGLNHRAQKFRDWYWPHARCSRRVWSKSDYFRFRWEQKYLFWVTA